MNKRLALEEARERVALLEAALERHAARSWRAEMLRRALRKARVHLKALQAESFHDDIRASGLQHAPQ